MCLSLIVVYGVNFDVVPDSVADSELIRLGTSQCQNEPLDVDVLDGLNLDLAIQNAQKWKDDFEPYEDSPYDDSYPESERFLMEALFAWLLAALLWFNVGVVLKAFFSTFIDPQLKDVKMTTRAALEHFNDAEGLVEELIEKRDREKLTEKAMDDINGKLDKIKKYFDDHTNATRDELNKKSQQELIEYIASSEWYNRLSSSTNIPVVTYRGITIRLPKSVMEDKERMSKVVELVSSDFAVGAFEARDGNLRIDSQFMCDGEVARQMVNQLTKKLRKHLVERMGVPSDAVAGLSVNVHTKESWKDVVRHKAGDSAAGSMITDSP